MLFSTLTHPPKLQRHTRISCLPKTSQHLALLCSQKAVQSIFLREVLSKMLVMFGTVPRFPCISDSYLVPSIGSPSLCNDSERTQDSGTAPFLTTLSLCPSRPVPGCSDHTSAQGHTWKSSGYSISLPRSSPPRQIPDPVSEP